MLGDDIARVAERTAMVFAVLIFFAGIATGLLAQWLFPIIKAWIHWATG